MDNENRRGFATCRTANLFFRERPINFFGYGDSFGPSVDLFLNTADWKSCEKANRVQDAMNPGFIAAQQSKTIYRPVSLIHLDFVPDDGVTLEFLGPRKKKNAPSYTDGHHTGL